MSDPRVDECVDSARDAIVESKVESMLEPKVVEPKVVEPKAALGKGESKGEAGVESKDVERKDVEVRGSVVGAVYEEGALDMPFAVFAPEAPDCKPVEKEMVFDDQVMLLRNVLSSSEVQYLIDETEKVGYKHCGFDPKVRNNDRILIASKALADRIWSRVKPYIEGWVVKVDEGDPDCSMGIGGAGTWRPYGLNECWRFCRYESGGHFGPHCDGQFQRSDDDRSALTFMLYLNGGLEGGTTNFMDRDAEFHRDEDGLVRAKADTITYRVAPEPGMLICFRQRILLHEGGQLKSGRKYILRSDVMFHRDPDSKAPTDPKHADALRLYQEAGELEAAGDVKGAIANYNKAYRLWPALEGGAS